MFFASDNAGPAHPKVLEALTKANDGYRMGYGADAEMIEVRDKIRDIFEAPDAMVHLVSTGTAANALLLACLANPWDTIFCTKMAHIHEDECNAPEFYSGAKLSLVEDINAKMTPETLRAAIEAEQTRGVHGPQRGPVSLTSVTEKGTIYSCEELASLTAVAKDYDLPVHLDGARFANAMVALECSPAEMTWKAGIDAVSFGGTKNGLMGVEACILFNPEKTYEFELRRKRGGHLFSKHRYLSAQMLAYLTDDLWIEMARDANAAAKPLIEALEGHPEVDLPWTPEANVMFFKAPRKLHQSLLAAGMTYYVMDGSAEDGDPSEILTGRLVTNWATGDFSLPLPTT